MPLPAPHTIRFLALGIALAALLAVPLLTYGSFVRPCDAASITEITVLVNDEMRGVFGMQQDTTLSPIEVEPSQTVEVRAKAVAQPASCQGGFVVDWEWSFVVFNPQDIRTITSADRSERVVFLLGEQRNNPFGEDHIVVVVHDLAGQQVRTGLIRLKGKSP